MNDDEARSTERPPAPDEEAAHDLAKAIRAAKNNTPGRYGPPQATAKIGAFDLAQALQLSSADGDHPPGSSKPPRDDDAPFVGGEVEVVGVGEVEVPSGVAGSGDSKPPGAASKPPSVKKSTIHTMPTLPEPIAPISVDTAIVPRRQSRTGLVLLGLAVGLLVIAYAFVTANR